MRFLIAGGTGFLGRRLSARLSATGHEVTVLTRGRPQHSGEVSWDPYAGRVDRGLIEATDVVVGLAGAPTLGNPHSRRWADALLHSRVVTTRVLAEAIGASDRRPAFLAGNGISIYGDHGDETVSETADSRGNALLTRVTAAWQEATTAAVGARVCILRTAPVYDRANAPLRQQRLLFRLGLGGRFGSGRQYVPLISVRDWVDAVIFVAEQDALAGPVNLCCPNTPTNAEFTAELARLVHRPAFCHVPAAVLRVAAGAMAPELLGSVRAEPRALLDAGYRFHDPTVHDVLVEGLSPVRAS